MFLKLLPKVTEHGVKDPFVIEYYGGGIWSSTLGRRVFNNKVVEDVSLHLIIVILKHKSNKSG